MQAKLTKISFKPLIYGYNQHIMTIATYFTGLQFLWELPMKYSRDFVAASDGNKLFLDWITFDDDDINEAFTNNDADNKIRRREIHDEGEDSVPIILLIHGLGGSSKDQFVKRMALLAHHYGMRPVSYYYWRLVSTHIDYIYSYSGYIKVYIY